MLENASSQSWKLGISYKLMWTIEHEVLKNPVACKIFESQNDIQEIHSWLQTFPKEATFFWEKKETDQTHLRHTHSVRTGQDFNYPWS